MKKNLLITGMAMLLWAGGCQSDPSAELVLGSEELKVPYAGGTFTIPVSCNLASKATIEYDNPAQSGWIFMLPTVLNGNGTLELRIQALSNMWEDRSATITVTADEDIKTVKLLQMSKLHLSVEPSFIAASSKADSYPVAVTSKTAWTATVESGAPWCTLTGGSGNNDGAFTVNVTAMPDENQRTATVLVNGANGLSEKITVQQAFVSDFVEINGLLWAKYNVGEPGSFTSSPDEPGLLYQWNSKVGWPNASPKSDSNVPPGYPTGQIYIGFEWETKNCPCPEGWRIPTVEEIEALTGSNSNPKFAWLEIAQSGFTRVGAVVGIPASEGRQATKDNLRGGIFIPRAGYRTDEGVQNDWWSASMSSSTSINGWDRYNTWTTPVDQGGGSWVPSCDTRTWARNYAAWPVRCVKDK